MRNLRDRCKIWKMSDMVTKVKEINILKNEITSLKETSKYLKDQEDRADYYMAASMLEVVNFDSVKSKYVEKLAVPETPTSVDAFYVASDGNMYLIEFKSGGLAKRKIVEVKLKIFDSLLLLTDILQCNISETREQLNFILVYNETKNPKKKMNKMRYSLPYQERRLTSVFQKWVVMN